jgi:hypothetical protein
MPSSYAKFIPATPPTSPTSPHSPKESNFFTAQSTYPDPDPESLLAPEAPTVEHIEDVRYHQDYSEQSPNGALRQPRVNLPSQQNYYGNVLNSYDREDEEIDDIGGLDGSDIDVEDVELDELLELEADGIDADLYRQLHEAIPSDFIARSAARSEPSLPLNHTTSGSSGQTAGSPRTSSMFSLLSPTGSQLPPLPPLPGSLDSNLVRSEVWMTIGEYVLSRDRRYSPYRVKKPSGLRTCWKPKVSGEDDQEGSFMI